MHLTRVLNLFMCHYVLYGKKHEWVFRDNYFISNIYLLSYGAIFTSIKSSIFISVTASFLDCVYKARIPL